MLTQGACRCQGTPASALVRRRHGLREHDPKRAVTFKIGTRGTTGTWARVRPRLHQHHRRRPPAGTGTCARWCAGGTPQRRRPSPIPHRTRSAPTQDLAGGVCIRPRMPLGALGWGDGVDGPDAEGRARGRRYSDADAHAPSYFRGWHALSEAGGGVCLQRGWSVCRGLGWWSQGPSQARSEVNAVQHAPPSAPGAAERRPRWPGDGAGEGGSVPSRRPRRTE